MTLQQSTNYAECTPTLFIMLNVHMVSSTSVYDQWNVKWKTECHPSQHFDCPNSLSITTLLYESFTITNRHCQSFTELEK